MKLRGLMITKLPEGLSRIFHASAAFISKALRGAAVPPLAGLQVPDNEGNGRCGQRPKVKIFQLKKKNLEVQSVN
jgi:hypothetical protein